MQTFPVYPHMIKGAVGFRETDTGLQPYRLPWDSRHLFPSPGDAFMLKAAITSGTRIVLSTDSPLLQLEYDSFEQDRLIDLTDDTGEVLESRTLPANSSHTEIKLPDSNGGTKQYAVWLPHNAPIVLKSISIEDDCQLEFPGTSRPRWITYGSSITMAKASHGPARTWPAVVARANNFDLLSLGFGGQCHLDPMVARLIRDMHADFISLKLGINVYGTNSLSPRTFQADIIGFISIIREKHPRTPIAVISPIPAPNREKTENKVGFTLEGMRPEVESAVERIRRVTADRNLYYFSGKDLFTPKMAEMNMPDSVHPDGDGQEMLGQQFNEKVVPQIPGLQ